MGFAAGATIYKIGIVIMIVGGLIGLLMESFDGK